MKFVLFLALTFSLCAFCDDTKTILESSVVKSMGQLMNDKHQGQCTLPHKAQDVHWMCLGLMMPVKVPQITSNRCGFMVEIVCPEEKALLFGERVSFHVQFPNDMEAIVIKPTETTISFNSIVIK